MRRDAYSIVWVYRRPVAHRTQDIGVFYSLIKFINIIAIISNSFTIAFTSKYSERFENNESRFIFAAIFEVINTCFFLFNYKSILFPISMLYYFLGF